MQKATNLSAALVIASTLAVGSMTAPRAMNRTEVQTKALEASVGTVDPDTIGYKEDQAAATAPNTDGYKQDEPATVIAATSAQQNQSAAQSDQHAARTTAMTWNGINTFSWNRSNTTTSNSTADDVAASGLNVNQQ